MKNLDELRAHCEKAIARGGEDVVLVLNGRDSRGDYVRLWPGSGPKGKIVGSRPGGLVVCFKAREVMAALGGQTNEHSI